MSQSSSNSLCLDLVLKIATVVEIQMYENSRGAVTRNEKTLALFVKLYTHQRIFNRVFRCHQIVRVMVLF